MYNKTTEGAPLRYCKYPFTGVEILGKYLRRSKVIKVKTLPTFTCCNLTKESQEQDVKYVQKFTIKTPDRRH